MAALVCGGLFDRHPRLRVATIETGSSWVGPLLSRFKKAYGQMPFAFQQDPVEAFRKHVWVSPYYEDDLPKLRDLIGADHVLFGSDFPHAEGLAEPTEFVNDLEGYSAARHHGDARQRAVAGTPDLRSAMADARSLSRPTRRASVAAPSPTEPPWPNPPTSCAGSTSSNTRTSGPTGPRSRLLHEPARPPVRGDPRARRQGARAPAGVRPAHERIALGVGARRSRRRDRLVVLGVEAAREAADPTSVRVRADQAGRRRRAAPARGGCARRIDARRRRARSAALGEEPKGGINDVVCFDLEKR